MNRRIKVSGTGCCLVDLIYNQVSFRSEEIKPFLSDVQGDGGLVPGQLVFRKELERYSGKELTEILAILTKGRTMDKINVGGPGIVAMISASQLCPEDAASFSFYGHGGKDRDGNYLLNAISNTRVGTDHYTLVDGTTPTTVVLSDPGFNRGQGERIFINSISVAEDYPLEVLNDSFFSSDVVVFGGTALVPPVHRALTYLLTRSKESGCMTVVNTVFDFLSEKSNPGKRWLLGRDDSSYSLIDLLIMDREEALRLSGRGDMEGALDFFIQHGTGAVVISQGVSDVWAYSNGERYSNEGIFNLPVSWMISEELAKGTKGDTTGCGDNFAGGIIASTVKQLAGGREQPDLLEAVSMGIVSGGFTCFYLGGVYQEVRHGEKQALIQPYYEAYASQRNT